jgi:nucleoside-diphosphate-sugar epimerase
MNILITGATGFIGSSLARNLIKEKHTIFCTLIAGETNPFGEVNVRSIIFSYQDIKKNIVFLKENDIEGIIHLASFVQSGEHNPVDVGRLIDTNIKFSTLLLETAVQAKLKWFINTGTFWQHYQNSEYSPVNLYAASKQAFESIAQYYIETNQIIFSTIQLFDTYGPNDTRPKFFSLWEKIAKTGEILDMSPGEQIIDISYIDDIVDAFILLSNNLSVGNKNIINGSVFALMAEKRYTLKQLASIFEEVTGYKLNINWGERAYRPREIMIPWTNGQRLPLWESKIGVREGIKKLLTVHTK